MSTGTEAARRARILPFLRALARHHRSPIDAFEEAGARAGGELVRLNMGPFQPYLITHPDHVQHVLRGNQPNYVREGMFWDPLAPLIGKGILSDGPDWAESRRIVQPLFTARQLEGLGERMAAIIAELVDGTLTPGRPFDVAAAMSAIVHATTVRLFFGESISGADIDRLAPAYDTGVTARAIRLVLPSVPQRCPMPGDRAFGRAVATIDEVVYPRIEHARQREGSGDSAGDVVSALCRAPYADKGDRRVRDDMVAIHGAATETAATALTWVWPVLDAHPEIAAKVYEEITRVVGDGPVTVGHLPALTYLRMFLSELLRLYPPGWILPRKALADDVIDGVAIEAGATVVLSPFLTQRLPQVWERPLEFDPERFAPGNERRRSRYAYFPFAAGPHSCVGPHLFMMEAQLLLAGILRSYRPVLHTPGPVAPRLASTLRPTAGLTMTLVPAARS
ncbi:cytochrome P450 [Nonomuraea ceibae]|uniref:cytochrome P450 n=1 Tax=Nonomuraea ceibae TaxID=1935170 RepID=UPI001C5D3E22|nr:cytochrome P450 [Nonomuraea ceibae]